MTGLRAVTPRVDAETGKLMTVESYVNECVTDRMGLKL
jgi:sulfur-oxidizing protein SoxA